MMAFAVAPPNHDISRRLITRYSGCPFLCVLSRMSSFSFDVFRAWLPSLSKDKKLDCFIIREHFSLTVSAMHLMNSRPVLPSSLRLINFTPFIFKHFTFEKIVKMEMNKVFQVQVLK